MANTRAPLTEADLLIRIQEILAERLPPDWAFRPGNAVTDVGYDGVIELVAPDGERTQLVLEVKRSVASRDVGRLLDRLTAWTRALPSDRTGTGVVVARYLSPQVRERIAEEGLSYADATGNVRVTSAKPGLFLSDHGADRDPWRGPGRPRGTLKGAQASKVVRVLLDFDRSWSVRQLVEMAQVSTGATYRVVQFLEEEELAERIGSRVRVPEWQALLRRWSKDYQFVDTSRTSTWLAARGLDRLLQRAAATNLEYAVTGTLAAAEWAPYAPARLAMIYTPNAAAAAAEWDLRPTEAGANVVLAEPESDVVFARTLTATSSRYRIAAPSQVAVDLLTGPGRNPSEGEELIEWMTRNEHSWRR